MLEPIAACPYLVVEELKLPKYSYRSYSWQLYVEVGMFGSFESDPLGLARPNSFSVSPLSRLRKHRTEGGAEIILLHDSKDSPHSACFSKLAK